MRTVISDQTLFDECIESFRKEYNNYSPGLNENKERVSYIMTDFVIEDDIKIKDICIGKSMIVHLEHAYFGYVSKVVLPRWVGHNSESLFTIALSSIMSFYTGRVVKSPRDNLFSKREIREDDLKCLAIQNPTLIAGPGFVNNIISKADVEIMIKDLDDIINLLWEISIDKYRKIMYAVRLAALSIYNVRTDFALGYYLMTSSIESIAQIAIKRKSKKHLCEEAWSKRAENDQEFKMVFEAYKKERGNNQYLAERFQKFILKYCPISEWGKLKHPMEEVFRTSSEGNVNLGDFGEKQPGEYYPEDLQEDEIKEILNQTYNYRSRFTHQGKNSPHKFPSDRTYKFFEVAKGDSFEEIKLINYRLLHYINKNSIINYLREIGQKQ